MQSFRFSIATLMGAVILAAVGLAALRSPTEMWAGVMTLVTCGLLALALIGAICGQGAPRASWLGFALFGWGYLAMAFWLLEYSSSKFPTIALLGAVASKMGAAPVLTPAWGGQAIDPNYCSIGHCIWSLSLGLLGAILARLLFGSARGLTPHMTPEPTPPVPSRHVWSQWPGMPVTLMSMLVVVTSISLLAFRSKMVLWSAATILLTLATLGLAVLGAVFNRERRRARWLGFALFGLGYLVLGAVRHPDLQILPALATDTLVSAAQPLGRLLVRGHAGSHESLTEQDARVFDALEKRVAFPFAEETTLEDVLKYVKQATAGPDGPGIEIYVDPVGLQEAEKSMTSTVRNIQLDNVSVRVGLRACLAQLGMAYYVRHGILLVSSAEGYQSLALGFGDPYVLVGDCLVALLAAAFGGLAGGKVWAQRSPPDTPAAPRPAASSH